MVKKIVAEMGNLLSYLADINALSPQLLSKNNFAEMKSAIAKAIDEHVG